ncbi:MAG: SDR family NAD(P)-dependent oxidoreductase [Deltaproteobacteria bacterium]|nr:SDR family NAD(P)-dependent oxidoreductase [Deltaproteobacteria bacterium]
MKDFEGKVAVITGAASGIGFALAEKFADENMKVVLADLDKNALNNAGKAIEARGVETLAVVTDVSSQQDVDALAQKTLDKFGSVHVVCNNAGVIRGGLSWEVPLEDYRWHLEVNTWGVIHGIRTFMPILIEQDEEAVIVNTSSQSGITCTPYSAAYCLSKHAVVALSECLCHEVVMNGLKVQVAVLCPMAVDTNIDKSERIRPDRYKLPSDAKSEIADVVSEGLSAQLKKGITPERMAEQTLQAIREERFYIFSQSAESVQWKDNMKMRFDDILRGRKPTMPVL